MPGPTPEFRSARVPKGGDEQFDAFSGPKVARIDPLLVSSLFDCWTSRLPLVHAQLGLYIGSVTNSRISDGRYPQLTHRLDLLTAARHSLIRYETAAHVLLAAIGPPSADSSTERHSAIDDAAENLLFHARAALKATETILTECGASESTDQEPSGDLIEVISDETAALTRMYAELDRAEFLFELLQFHHKDIPVETEMPLDDLIAKFRALGVKTPVVPITVTVTTPPPILHSIVWEMFQMLEASFHVAASTYLEKEFGGPGCSMTDSGLGRLNAIRTRPVMELGISSKGTPRAVTLELSLDLDGEVPPVSQDPHQVDMSLLRPLTRLVKLVSIEKFGSVVFQKQSTSRLWVSVTLPVANELIEDSWKPLPNDAPSLGQARTSLRLCRYLDGGDTYNVVVDPKMLPISIDDDSFSKILGELDLLFHKMIPKHKGDQHTVVLEPLPYLAPSASESSYFTLGAYATLITTGKVIAGTSEARTFAHFDTHLGAACDALKLRSLDIAGTELPSVIARIPGRLLSSGRLGQFLGELPPQICIDCCYLCVDPFNPYNDPGVALEYIQTEVLAGINEPNETQSKLGAVSLKIYAKKTTDDAPEDYVIVLNGPREELIGRGTLTTSNVHDCIFDFSWAPQGVFEFVERHVLPAYIESIELVTTDEEDFRQKPDGFVLASFLERNGCKLPFDLVGALTERRLIQDTSDEIEREALLIELHEQVVLHMLENKLTLGKQGPFFILFTGET